MIIEQPSFQRYEVRNWTNDGSSIPDWVGMQMSGGIAANGTFSSIRQSVPRVCTLAML